MPLGTDHASQRLRADDKPVYGLYTYGYPRTGDREFADRFIDAAKAAIEDRLHLKAAALADHSMTSDYPPTRV